MRAARRRHRHESGQIIFVFALALVLFMFGLISLSADTAYEYTTAARIRAAAQAAAESGANDINPQFLYTGTPPVLNGEGGTAPYPGTVSYAQACATSGDDSALITSPVDSPGTKNGSYCTLTGECVYASVTKTVTLPIGLFFGTAVIHATYVAAPVTGTDIPSSSGYIPANCPAA